MTSQIESCAVFALPCKLVCRQHRLHSSKSMKHDSFTFLSVMLRQ